MEQNIQHDPNKSPENIYIPIIVGIGSILLSLYRYSRAVAPSETYYPGFYKVFWFERPFTNAFGPVGIIVFGTGLGILLIIIGIIFYYRIRIKPNRNK